MENTKKSKKAILIVIIIVIILLIISGLILYKFFTRDRNTPTEVLEAYIDCLENKDYEGMYSLISDSSKSRVNKETFLSRNKNIYEGIETTNIEVMNIKYDKDNKSLEYDMSFNTLAGKLTLSNMVNFDRQDDNKYYINWYSNLIFPELEENYKVRVYSMTGNRGEILDRNGNKLATNNENGEREYPYGEIASHLIGYVSGITEEELNANREKGYTTSSIIGKTGLEAAFEEKLKGKNGSGIYIVDENENIIKTIAETNIEDGEDVKTTIDIELQKDIYNEFNGDNGLSVAINPKTGEVLAMVSTPSFDSNKFITGFTDEEWNKLSTDENTPMFARYESTWVPGSSFKPITGAIGLKTNSFSANDDFGSSGLSWQKDSSWGDYAVTTLTTYGDPANLKNALIYSDNIYFAKAATKIGKTTFAKELLNIGFDKNIDFSIPMSSSQFADNNEFSSEIQLADSGYGQGQILLNPLHFASIYSSFANGGNMIKPHLEYSEKTKYLIENAFSKSTAKTIQNDLVQVVENPYGTAHSAKIDGITLAGKTGTAELKASKEDTGEEIGWFNAFVVSDNVDEQLLTINMIENVANKGGSHYLLSKVKNIFIEYLN